MTVPTSIRIDDELLSKIKLEADEEGRSISKQIEYIIKQYYKIVRITGKDSFKQ